MRVVLHILAQPDDELARNVIAQQSADSELQVKVSDLRTVVPDYTGLIEEIFAAESVAVW